MNDVVIRAEDIWKEYNLGVIGYGSLRTDVQSWWAKKNGKEDPNSKIDQIVHERSRNDRFWALQDISFEVRRGEVMGIIGRNGAGKSTLLKILSRLTLPTRGQLKIKGKVASLLEVGTGFHPELTGRENVYLNGAILGMTKDEIKSKFDEIVSFAEVEKFIDTPVKRYSSGMYVRLAFAVGAHLDSEILILDEVLAVGDSQFQKKCFNKIQEIQNGGRTILFVSHSSDMIKKICNRCIWLENGMLKRIGIADSIVNEYAGIVHTATKKIEQPKVVDLTGFKNKYGNNEIEILEVELINGFNNNFSVLWGESIKLKILAKSNCTLTNVIFTVGLCTQDEFQIVTVRSSDNQEAGDGFNILDVGMFEISIAIHHNIRIGNFKLQLGVSSGDYVFYYNPSVVNLEIIKDNDSKYFEKNYGVINCNTTWQFSQKNN